MESLANKLKDVGHAILRLWISFINTGLSRRPIKREEESSYSPGSEYWGTCGTPVPSFISARTGSQVAATSGSSTSRSEYVKRNYFKFLYSIVCMLTLELSSQLWIYNTLVKILLVASWSGRSAIIQYHCSFTVILHIAHAQPLRHMVGPTYME